MTIACCHVARSPRTRCRHCHWSNRSRLLPSTRGDDPFPFCTQAVSPATKTPTWTQPFIRYLCIVSVDVLTDLDSSSTTYFQSPHRKQCCSKQTIPLGIGRDFHIEVPGYLSATSISIFGVTISFLELEVEALQNSTSSLLATTTHRDHSNHRQKVLCSQNYVHTNLKLARSPMPT